MKKFVHILDHNWKYLFWYGLILIICTTYFQNMHSGEILAYDDQLIFKPMNSINSLIHYIDYIKKGYILDIQPIRDLSFYFDHLINNYFNWYSPQMTNVFLWVGILIILNLLLENFVKNSKIRAILIAFYAFSPVNTSNIAWISGRKHILATFFILLATQISMRAINNNQLKFKTIIIISILFFLSCLSQPINCLFPVWILIYIYLIEFKNNKKPFNDFMNHSNYKIFSAVLILISLGVIIINFTYYDSYYLISSRGINKYVNNVENPLGNTFLALGRYFYLCLFPFNALPSSHYVGSIENVVGLILFPLLIYVLYRFTPLEKRSVFYLGILYFFYPLIPVTFKMTNIFCSDTYLLNSGIGILILISIIATQEKFANKFFVFLIPYTLFLIFFNFNYAKAFLTDLNIWEYSYQHEPTPSSTTNLASYYTKEGKYNEAEYLLKRAEIWNPDIVFLGKLMAENYFRNNRLNLDDKLIKISAIKYNSPTKYFLLSELYAQKNDKINTFKNLKLIYANKRLFSIEMLPSKEKIIAYSLSTCDYFHLDGCEDEMLKIKSDPLFKNWNQEDYDSTYNFLKNNHQFNFVI